MNTLTLPSVFTLAVTIIFLLLIVMKKKWAKNTKSKGVNYNRYLIVMGILSAIGWFFWVVENFLILN